MSKKLTIISLTLAAILVFIFSYFVIGEAIKMTNENKETRGVKNMNTLKIKWQRLVSEGRTCPRCGSTEEELDKAISILKQSLSPLGIEVVLEKDELSVVEFKKDTLRSNQIWLNGKILEDWIGAKVSQSPCTDVCGPTECRTLGVGGEVYEVIPADLVVKAGLLAATQLIDTRTIESCCESGAPTSCCPK